MGTAKTADSSSPLQPSICGMASRDPGGVEPEGAVCPAAEGQRRSLGPLHRLSSVLTAISDALCWLALLALSHPTGALVFILWLAGPFCIAGWAWTAALHNLQRMQASWLRLLSGASVTADGLDTGASPAISGLAPGVTAWGNFLSAKAAALTSASAAAPRIAGKRIDRLLDAIKLHQKWMIVTEKQLEHVGVRLDGAETWTELQFVVNEVLSVIEKWRSMILERYYVQN